MRDGLTISIFELQKRFPNEEAAISYFEGRRWGQGRICPHCGKSIHQHRERDGYYRCGECRKVYTVRTGTIFERSHIPLRKWLFGIYFILTSRKGISSLQLSKSLGVTQKSAWYMLQRMRLGMSGCDFVLDGIVEMDEAYIGGKETNKHASRKLNQGRGSVGKNPVLGMKERNGRVIARVVDNADKDSAGATIDAFVSSKATVNTDESPIYGNVSQTRRHVKVNHSARQFVNGMASTNGIESVWACLKRMFYGTYHNFSRKHLQRYVDECTFRLNEGNCENHVWSRMESLLAGGFAHRITYSALIGKVA